jgi:hypothetical protein
LTDLAAALAEHRSFQSVIKRGGCAHQLKKRRTPWKNRNQGHSKEAFAKSLNPNESSVPSDNQQLTLTTDFNMNGNRLEAYATLLS